MTLADFLAALPDLKEHSVWYENELGQLRAFIPGPTGTEHSTITALCEVRKGWIYDCIVEWDEAADALGLSLEDASAIVSAEDCDSRCDAPLARALRQAVGVQHEIPVCRGP